MLKCGEQLNIFQRELDIVLGILLITGNLSASGIFISEGGQLSISITGPVLMPSSNPDESEEKEVGENE